VGTGVGKQCAEVVHVVHCLVVFIKTSQQLALQFGHLVGQSSLQHSLAQSVAKHRTNGTNTAIATCRQAHLFLMRSFLASITANEWRPKTNCPSNPLRTNDEGRWDCELRRKRQQIAAKKLRGRGANKIYPKGAPRRQRAPWQVSGAPPLRALARPPRQRSVPLYFLLCLLCPNTSLVIGRSR
jgi:hypothetical protein